MGIFFVIVFRHIWHVFKVSAHFEQAPCPQRKTIFLLRSMQILHPCVSSISAILHSRYLIRSALGCRLFAGITLPSFVILRWTQHPQLRHFFIRDAQSSQAGLCPQGSSITFSSLSSEQTQHSAGFLDLFLGLGSRFGSFSKLEAISMTLVSSLGCCRLERDRLPLAFSALWLGLFRGLKSVRLNPSGTERWFVLFTVSSAMLLVISWTSFGRFVFGL